MKVGYVRQYGVEAIPHIVFADSYGTELLHHRGILNAQDLMNVAQSQSCARRRSSVAEQLFCKQPVVSSTLTVGSRGSRGTRGTRGSCRSGQSELAVNQSGFALRRFESFTAHLLRSISKCLLGSQFAVYQEGW